MATVGHAMQGPGNILWCSSSVLQRFTWRRSWEWLSGNGVHGTKLLRGDCCMCMQVPGNIRRAEHFVAFLRRFVLYLKEKLGVNEVTTENPTTFLAQLQERLGIEGMYNHFVGKPRRGLE